MGMGEPADNADEVIDALKILTDVELFHIGHSKVIVSTVAPSPEAFKMFKDAPCVLAWSVHGANDKLRKQLVPTTKYSMNELRQSLIDTLLARPKRLQVTMIEIALISEVNDRPDDAKELANFIQVIVDSIPGIRLMVNLIPFNDIGHPTYRKPSMERVLAFQEVLSNHGILTLVRTTRGDDESAACGQLATKRAKRKAFITIDES
jgi:23S rRNA (adenine2503-C2)-methyltransferase